VLHRCRDSRPPKAAGWIVQCDYVADDRHVGWQLGVSHTREVCRASEERTEQVATEQTMPAAPVVVIWLDSWMSDGTCTNGARRQPPSGCSLHRIPFPLRGARLAFRRRISAETVKLFLFDNLGICFYIKCKFYLLLQPYLVCSKLGYRRLCCHNHIILLNSYNSRLRVVQISIYQRSSSASYSLAVLGTVGSVHILYSVNIIMVRCTVCTVEVYKYCTAVDLLLVARVFEPGSFGSSS